MRNTVLAALAALSFGWLSTAPAKADWREAILGNRIYSSAPAPAPKAKSAAHNQGSSKGSSYSSKQASKPKSTSTASSSYSGGGSTLSGQASYYWQPQKVASGGWFNPNALTAAHKTLPFGTRVQVTNQHNGKSVTVTINDRGPYVAGRIIDLSSAAAGVIGMKSAGVVPVKVTVLGK